MPKKLADYALSFKDTKMEPKEDGTFAYYKINENNEKIYITEMPKDIYVENVAKVFVNDTVNGITTNVVKNKLVNSKFDVKAEVFTTVGDLNPGEQFKYSIDVYNISENKIEDIIVEDILPKELTYLNIEQVETNYKEEFEEAKKAIEILGGKFEQIETFNLEGEMERNVLIIKKVKNTPNKFPRGQGKPLKEPIR